MDTLFTPPARAARRQAAACCGLAAALLALVSPAQADPVLTTHFSQATYDVDVRAGSELLGAFGFSGIGTTSYSTSQALSGDGVILQAFAGEYVTRTQVLKLHFQSHAGYVFDTLSMSHLLSFFNDRGGWGAKMSWVLDTEDGPAQTGTTSWLEDGFWFHGGTLSDFSQLTPTLSIGGDDAFDLDVTLQYYSAGFPGGCFTASGVCQQISANSVKVFVATVPGIDDDPPVGTVPVPSTLALLLGAGLVRLLRRPARAGGLRLWAALLSAACVCSSHAATVTLGAGDSALYNFDFSGATPAPPYVRGPIGLGQMSFNLTQIDVGEHALIEWYDQLDGLGPQLGSYSARGGVSLSLTDEYGYLTDVTALLDGQFSVRVSAVGGEMNVVAIVGDLCDRNRGCAPRIDGQLVRVDLAPAVALPAAGTLPNVLAALLGLGLLTRARSARRAG